MLDVNTDAVNDVLTKVYSKCSAMPNICSEKHPEMGRKSLQLFGAAIQLQ